MTEGPLVSILMPVHNDAAFLDECIQSTINQEYSNWEYCIVDDGSTDSSSLKLEKWSRIDKRIHYISSGHQGIVPSLNAAAKLANGSIIARMDADDAMRPNRLLEQVSFLSKNSEVGLIGSCFQYFSNTKSESIPKWILHHEDWSNRLLSSDDIHQALFAESPIAHPTFCMRKEIFEKLGGYHDSSWAEDYDFLHRARIQGVILGKVASTLVDKRFNHECISNYEPRYRQATNMEAKVYFGNMKQIFNGRDLWVVGSGGSAKSLLSTLQKFEIPVEGIIDNKIHRGTPRKLMGNSVSGISNPENEKSWEKFKSKRLLLAIGGEKGQQLVNQFKSWGWKQPEDFVKLV
ncbi:MAG: glycosyltransferase [Proteobacteria bacterium]|nr:MAG: glycosyltransferase [Pseudomonadota bacterium]